MVILLLICHIYLSYIPLEAYTFVNQASLLHRRKVLNVVPGDFTQDGRLDFLVMSQGSPSSQLDLQLYVALPEGGFGMHLTHFILVNSNGGLSLKTSIPSLYRRQLSRNPWLWMWTET